MTDLKNAMDNYLSHIDLNRRWMNGFTEYYFKLFTKDESTMSFFGEGLWGVYPIYFTIEDSNIWFDDILQIDDVGLRNVVKSLYAENEKIDVKWQRATDLVNLTLIYMTHRFLISKLPDREKLKGCKYCLSILHYKFLSSLQHHRFRYAANKEVAVAVYAQLTKKVLVKVCGSWRDVLDKRSNDIIDRRGIHYNVLTSYRDDYEVVKVINEIQNRVRKMANFLTEEFNKVKEQGKVIEVGSRLISDEEGERISESVNKFNVYKNYIHRVIADRGDLIKDDLIEVVEKTTNRLPRNSIKDSLGWISDNSHSNIKSSIDNWLNLTLEYSFRVIRENGFKTNELSLIIKKLRSLFLSSRTSNETLIEVKREGLKLIETSAITESKSSQITLRSSLMLYMVLRTLSMKHYG